MGHGPDPVLDEATREIMERHAQDHSRCGPAPSAPPSLRVPMTGLAAVAWNAHLDAANLERYQRGALEAEIQRLQKQADDMDAGTEKRRMGVLRAVVTAAFDRDPLGHAPDLDPLTGPIGLDHEKDGTLVAVLTVE